MEKPHRMAQIYGYTVCLVAVIAFLICVANIIPATMDLSDPMHAGSSYVPPGTPSLASFDNYKMDILKSSSKENGQAALNYIPDDKTLKSMYDAAVSDKILSANHSSMRTIVVSGLIIAICIVLFTVHWIWMRKLSKSV